MVLGLVVAQGPNGEHLSDERQDRESSQGHLRSSSFPKKTGILWTLSGWAWSKPIVIVPFIQNMAN